jgi:hypothetical protein
MLPNVRLIIAATLASVLALSCGFGIFAVVRVSHEPFAHLPAPMAPPQLVAENTVPLTAHGLRGGEESGRLIDIPLRAAEDTTSSTGGAEIHASAYAEEPEQKAAPDAIVAAVIDPPGSIGTQDKLPAETSAAMTSPAMTSAAIGAPAQATTTPSVTVSELPPLPQGEDRASNPVEVNPLDRPASEPTATSVAAINNAATERTTAADPSSAAGSNTSEKSPSAEAFPAAPAADSASPHVANAEAEPVPADAAQQSAAPDSIALATPPDLPLPRERPAVTPTSAADVAPPPHVRRLAPVAVAPRRPRILIRAIHAPRFASAYYVRAPYAQSTDQDYAYGQAVDAQGQVVIRRMVRPRLVARRIYPATGIR